MTKTKEDTTMPVTSVETSLEEKKSLKQNITNRMIRSQYLSKSGISTKVILIEECRANVISKTVDTPTGCKSPTIEIRRVHVGKSCGIPDSHSVESTEKFMELVSFVLSPRRRIIWDNIKRAQRINALNGSKIILIRRHYVFVLWKFKIKRKEARTA